MGFIAGAFLFYLGSTSGNSSPVIVIAFLIGAVFSALAGFIGMKIATKANVRTAQAAKTSLSTALNVSFSGGSVMGMGVAGLAVLGLGSLFIVFYKMFVPSGLANGQEMEKALEVLTGFSLGAESIALFARVGGGIYTKAADVGADLVGKVEAGIPEDDPRNPATIADNVGDNVGDVAGMGADLFGSYVATILATMVLGREVMTKVRPMIDKFGGLSPIFLPMAIAGMGIIASLIGILCVRVKEGGNVQAALNLGNYISVVVSAVASYFLIMWILPAGNFTIRGISFDAMHVFYAVLVGLVVGTLMSIITEYYTAMGKRPVNSIVQQSSTGHATTVIGGLAVGMESTVLPILVLAAGIVLSYEAAGLYGVAIAAAGMMATTAMQLAIDAFGPIADNAGGIAEMCELPKEVRERTDILDAVGNTTAATGKGFAIASAALTSLALFAAFMGTAHITSIDISKAPVLAGVFVGAMIPFIFLLAGHCGRGPGRHGHGAGSAPPVPRDSGHYGRHGPARVREVRGHLHPGRYPGDDFAGCHCLAHAHHRGLRLPGLVLECVVARSAGRPAGRRHGERRADGHVPEQRRRRLGQRQKVVRKRRDGERQDGVQRLRRPQSFRNRRHRGRPLQGHLRPEHEHPHQADEHRVAGHCAPHCREGRRARHGPGAAGKRAHRNRRPAACALCRDLAPAAARVIYTVLRGKVG